MSNLTDWYWLLNSHSSEKNQIWNILRGSIKLEGGDEYSLDNKKSDYECP